MQGLLRAIIRTEAVSTKTMAEFMNLYDIHAKTPEGQTVTFLEQLDQPGGLEFTEHTFDTVVYRYDDLRGGASPEEATPIEFDRAA
jgi:hypothetical protein